MGTGRLRNEDVLEKRFSDVGDDEDESGGIDFGPASEFAAFDCLVDVNPPLVGADGALDAKDFAG